MSQKKTSKFKYPVNCTSADEAEKFIRGFLTKHPGFFKLNQDLLEKLDFPHTGIGSNQSLLERQNTNLKIKVKDYERKFSLLIDSADANEKIFMNLIHWIQDLMKSKKMSIHPKKFIELLNENFKVNFATILILSLKNSGYRNFSKYKLNPEHFLHTKVKNTSKTIFLKLPSVDAESWLNFFKISGEGLELKPLKNNPSIYEKLPIELGSMAIIPLKNPDTDVLLGVLLMVSKDESKFDNKKGVVFLNSIAEILSSILISKLSGEVSSS